jgi:DNA-binding response OmpR family regulator
MKADPSVARLRFDRFELDEAEARLMCVGEPVALAPKPFAVLCALARTPGRQSLVELAEECPEAVQLMRGRTFARAVH